MTKPNSLTLAVAEIENLSMIAKASPWVCVVGVVLPFIALLGGVIGLSCEYRRRRLLLTVAEPAVAEALAAQTPRDPDGVPLVQRVEYLRQLRYTFFAPLIVFIIWALLVFGMYLFSQVGAR